MGNCLSDEPVAKPRPAPRQQQQQQQRYQAPAAGYQQQQVVVYGGAPRAQYRPQQQQQQVRRPQQQQQEQKYRCPECLADVPVNLRNPHNRDCPRRPSKIRAATGIMQRFLLSVMGPHDRSSVVAFNDKYIPLLDVGPQALACAALEAMVEVCTNSTHLYDAIVVAVEHFNKTAARDRPWLLIVLTDGDDTGSQLGLEHAMVQLQRFNAPSDNFAFIIGLGNDVKEANMRHLCEKSGAAYVPAADSAALDVIFAMIAIQVVRGVRVDIATLRDGRGGAEAAFARVREEAQLRRKAIDVLLLVDVSGSMNMVA